jgi:hypothetical protein
MKLSDKIKLRYYEWKWKRQYQRAFHWLNKSERDLFRTNPTLAGVTRAKVSQTLVGNGKPMTLTECNKRTSEAIEITLDALRQELRRQSRSA